MGQSERTNREGQLGPGKAFETFQNAGDFKNKTAGL
jgi:hypothetical protein